MEKTLTARNPRTGETDFSFTATSQQVLAKAAARLRAAQKDWAALSLSERSEKMLTLAETIKAKHKDIGGALEIDTGRRRIAHLEALGAAASIRSWVEQAPRLLPEGWTDGRRNPAFRHAPQFVPLGLVGVISPWNFPLTLSMIDTIPALLAGCAVIVKPSEVTPRFVDPMMEAIEAAGMSDLLTFVQGDGETGAALIDEVDGICFTGSVATGQKVAMAAAKAFIPAFLELGGKDPLIITETANLEMASDAALRGSVLSTGQACQSIERIYVQRSIHDAFVERLVEKANAARLNWPDISQGEIGPIIFDKQGGTLMFHLEDAVAKGAEIRTGGAIESHGGGIWLRPTVLTGVTHTMAVMREETFGPILPVMAFDTAEEAIALANDTEFGLSAAVIAGTLEEAEAIGRQIDAGAISLNDAALTAMFHEAEKQSFKLSGLGASRMGPAGYQRFLRRKALIANTSVPSPLAAFAEEA